MQFLYLLVYYYHLFAQLFMNGKCFHQRSSFLVQKKKPNIFGFLFGLHYLCRPMGIIEQDTYQRIPPFVEIMDSTLRDGEQTSGVSFMPHEKLMIARKLLHDVNVDRIEVASARVSDGEKEAVGMICRYARQIDRLERVEVLGFVDGGKSVDWIADCGGKVINLLAKGSQKHCVQQLGKTPEEHIADILDEDFKGSVTINGAKAKMDALIHTGDDVWADRKETFSAPAEEAPAPAES